MPKITLEAFDLIRDADMLLGWLVQPHVAKWWGDAGRAMQHARGCAPESHALIVADGTPVGYLCWQEPPKQELEAADLTDLPSGLVDVDILIGDRDLLGHGVGSRALELLLARLRCDPSVAFVGLGTSASNTNAIRCFEKAGFRLHREFQDPEWGPCKYLMAEVHGAA
jgi:aminoglycoside 6'-N-acetyltransferase